MAKKKTTKNNISKKVKPNGLSDYVLAILIILTGVTIIAFLAGLTSLKQVNNYDECVEAGYVVLAESDQCITPTGQTFVKDVAFCGISTFGECNTNQDCKVSGCSGQVCQSVNEEELMTTCEHKECYDVPGVICECSESQCQWDLN